MSPQLLWSIAGLILTVLTLGGVTISSYQSQDSAKIKLVAAEFGNLATASKLWLVNDATTNGSYDGITNAAVSPYIPDLINAGGSSITKIDPFGDGTPNFYTLTNSGVNLVITLSLSLMADPGAVMAFSDGVVAALANKPCAANYQAVPMPMLTYTCAP